MNAIDKARDALTAERARLAKLLERDDLPESEAAALRQQIETIENEIDGIDHAREYD